MKQIDLFRATVEHRYVGKRLFYARFTPEAEKSILGHYGFNSFAELQIKTGMFRPEPSYLRSPVIPKEARDYTKYYTESELTEGSFINNLGVLEVPGSSYHFTRLVSPLRNAESAREIEEYPYLDLYGFDDSEMAEDVKKARDKGSVSFTALGNIYETAWMIRGYEGFLMDMMDNEDHCNIILDKMCDTWTWLARKAAISGVDLITCGDDVANQNTLMFSKDIWRKFIKSRWKRVFDAAREINPDIQIKYHSDGNVADIIDELIEIGITILNPVQPECMDLKQIKKEYGNRIVFDGALGTQTTLPFGSAKDVRDEVKRIEAEYGYDGGIIIAPSHKVEPEVPLENIVAFIDECMRLNE